jgi:L-ascorbate metabolism protein UlaG (beta-lactamase superfamily)
MKLALENIGCKNVIALDEMESIELDNGSITAIPFLGEHSDLNICSKSAFVVRFGNRSLLLAADSCSFEPKLYEHLHAEIGNVDALFIGMECDGAPMTWLYGPLMTKSIERAIDESRRLSGSNFDQAMDIVQRFNCKSVHVYAMGQEPWLGYIMSLRYTEQSRPIIESNRLVRQCLEQGIHAERLYGGKETILDD